MKKVLVVILVAIMIGGGIAFFFFKSLVIKDDKNGMGVGVARAFQIGAFTNYDNALRVADRNNGIVVTDDDIYRVYVAILKDAEAINKLSSYYEEIGLNYYLKEISISDEFSESITETDELLKRSSSDTYNAINMSVLSKYEEGL